MIHANNFTAFFSAINSFTYFRKVIILSLAILVNICMVNAQAYTVVIDPGHGGSDPGNLRSDEKFMQEKDINLIIAKKLGGYIDSLLEDVKIVYTRTTDVYVSPQERAEFANSSNADYFISIHCNHNDNSEIVGFEVHIHNYECRDANKFAKNIVSELKDRASRNSRGVKTYDDRRNMHILVVRDTDMPAVLVECGFMSNPTEEYYLNTDYGQSIIASAIYRAFRNHSGALPKKIETKKTVSPPENKTPKTVYRVQIKASSVAIPLDAKEFSKLDVKIDEVVVEKDAPYKYKYCVGQYETFEEANKMKNKLRSKGFEDAFVFPPKE